MSTLTMRSARAPFQPEETGTTGVPLMWKMRFRHMTVDQSVSATDPPTLYQHLKLLQDARSVHCVQFLLKKSTKSTAASLPGANPGQAFCKKPLFVSESSQ